MVIILQGSLSCDDRDETLAAAAPLLVVDPAQVDHNKLPVLLKHIRINLYNSNLHNL